MNLLERIEKHLKDNHISATRFGRRAVGDPRFVLDLRMGRRPRRRTLERLEAYLAALEVSTKAEGVKNGSCVRSTVQTGLPLPARVPRPPVRTRQSAARLSAR